MSHRRPTLNAALLATVSLSAGCAPATNLLSPTQPAFLGQYAPARAPAGGPLRVVTFNIKESQQIDRAIAFGAFRRQPREIHGKSSLVQAADHAASASVFRHSLSST